jgi:hypothetical protein
LTNEGGDPSHFIFSVTAMKDSLSCDTCHDLDIGCLNSLITFASLSKSAADGCNVCATLKNGLGHINDHFSADDTLEFVLDSSLYVFVKDKDGESCTVEFYTHKGTTRFLFHPRH